MGQKIISMEELKNEPYASMAADIQQAFGTAAHIPLHGGIAEDVLAYLSENADRFCDELDFAMLLGSMVQEKAGTDWFAFVLEQYGSWEAAQRGFYAECVMLALQHGVPLAELREKMSSGSDIYEIFEFADNYHAQSMDPSAGIAGRVPADSPAAAADADAGGTDCKGNSPGSGEDEMEENMEKQGTCSRTEDAGKIRRCAEPGVEAAETAGSLQNNPENGFAEESPQGNADIFLQYMDAVAGGKVDDTQVMNLLRDTFGQAQKYLNEVFEIRRAEAERVRSLERVNTVQADRIRRLTERISLMQQENRNLRSRLSDAARNEKVSENIAQKLREIASMQESVTRSDFSGYLLEDSGMGH